MEGISFCTPAGRTLLFNAGLGVQTGQLKNLGRYPLIVAAGLTGNVFVPIAFIGVVSQTLRLWHNPDEVQNTLVGLALVASMPIAGSSTAWSQNANGNLALSLGLVVLSTLLSPLTTPVLLHAAGFLTTGDYSEDLHALASSGTGGFLAIGVILPALLGMAGHVAVGEARIASSKPVLKLFNSINLLLLNYSNASLSLPETIADPDWDFLAVVLATVICLCVLAFASGWLIARLVGADGNVRISLMFGLGMNNNGTGLVLASMALADHPRVLLPILFYNLVQHVVAGGLDFALARFSGRLGHSGARGSATAGPASQSVPAKDSALLPSEKTAP
ncbi:MAG TPA: bile acid:sodium symporter [Gemmataceae bacterium]|nr:bile acid:sodium symporter [Gemmataceae bacterium]